MARKKIALIGGGVRGGFGRTRQIGDEEHRGGQEESKFQRGVLR